VVSKQTQRDSDSPPPDHGSGVHAPVLLEEALAGLQVKADGYYLDATFGRGGHAGEILKRLGAQGRLCAVDRDPHAVSAARAGFGRDERVHIVHGRFGQLRQLVPAEWAQRGFDGVLFDLGVSSPQLDRAERGFSFLRDGPLDMRMDTTQGESAAQWLARVSERDLVKVLRELGEEKFSGRIARVIVERRQVEPIERTGDLADLIFRAVPKRDPHRHPATKSFQAIRMYVNRELDELASGLEAALELLTAGGRLCVISFHSLEDRAVKQFMRRHSTVDPVYAGLPHIPAHVMPKMRLAGKAVRAGEAELEANPRARSATLRVAEKVAA
jgi:16S rRNA (cytosine1402-N4)-methyltransferase